LVSFLVDGVEGKKIQKNRKAFGRAVYKKIFEKNTWRAAKDGWGISIIFI